MINDDGPDFIETTVSASLSLMTNPLDRPHTHLSDLSFGAHALLSDLSVGAHALLSDLSFCVLYLVNWTCDYMFEKKMHFWWSALSFVLKVVEVLTTYLRYS